MCRLLFGKDFFLLFRERGIFQHIGALLQRALHRLLQFPVIHLCVVTRQQDRRHLSPPPLRRTGVLRMLQQMPIVALQSIGILVGKDTGKHAADAVCEDAGGELPSCEDIVPNGDLLVHDLFQDPLIDPLVVAAEQDKVRIL